MPNRSITFPTPFARSTVSDKKLIIYTLSYPYGAGEQFITPELTVLSKYFSEIILMPELPQGEPLKDLPHNVKVVCPDNKITRTHYFKGAITVLKQRQGLRRFRYFLAMYKSNYQRALGLKSFLNTENLHNAIHFSYWFYNWATVLSILKKEGVISRFFSRAHGFDLYDYRSATGSIPFRKFQLQQITKVFAVSGNGADYLKTNYPEYADKVMSIPIGTLRLFKEAIQQTRNEKLLVSCSRIIKLKRLDLLAKAISQFKEPARWVHFGDGPEKDNLQKIIANMPAHIQVELKGNSENQLIHEFYATQHPDLFINISEHEGLPVSIMETISYGIPVLATNVGGTGEIVNSITGKLVDSHIDTDHLTTEIQNMLSKKFSKEDIISFWKENYSAEVNVKKLAAELTS